MNVVVQVLNFISQEILNVPAYLDWHHRGPIGSIALKRSAGQVVSGALKAAMGYLILGAGATVVTSALGPVRRPGAQVHRRARRRAHQ